MSRYDDFTIGLDEALSWLDRPRHEVVGEFDVERGYFWTACAAVQNGGTATKSACIRRPAVSSG